MNFRKTKKDSWESLKEKNKKVSQEKYSYCTTLKRWLPVSCFYKNSSKPNGLQTECKIVIQAREYRKSLEEILKKLSAKEKELYGDIKI